MARITGDIVTDGKAGARYVAGRVQANAGFNATGLVLGSGVIAFAGNFKQAGGWPSNGVNIIVGTTALAILASIADNSVLAEPAKWLAILMLLSVLIRYVPKFTQKTAKKGK